MKEKENRQQVLEKNLARASTEFRANEEYHKVNFQSIQNNLGKGEATIEFIHFNKPETDSTMYAAVILLPSREIGWVNKMINNIEQKIRLFLITPNLVNRYDTLPKTLHYIPLFEEKKLEELADSTEDIVEFTNQFYRGVVPKNKPDLSQRLYQHIWQPLDSLLEGTQTIYYSPSGLLHRLNMAAIPIDSTSRLSDRYQLHQLSSTREIAIKEKSYQNTSAVLFGGIDYGFCDTKETIDSTENYKEPIIIEGEANWNLLPGTATEVDSIGILLDSAKFNIQVFKNGLATEETFKLIDTTTSPRILHLATHGFFNPKVDTFLADPMLRSGLIFAGANCTKEHGEAPPKKENGILTAYEISQMNLTQTELVVLSACVTGLGEIKGSEGVFGLQRAFKKAGAKYLIISLWDVPDESTKELMVSFYQKWLAEKMDIPTAFKAAQQEMRKLYPKNPYDWAGFVLMQ